MITIFDLHMTLADTRHRTQNGTHEWTDEEIMRDEPSFIFYIFNDMMFDREYLFIGENVYISTGGNEKYREIIIKWIENNLDRCSFYNEEDRTESFYHRFLMRSPEDKHLSNVEVKRKNLKMIKERHPDETEFLVFDDEHECIAMYKEEGCKTCLVDLK